MKITTTIVLALALTGVASISFAQTAGPKGGVKPGKAAGQKGKAAGQKGQGAGRFGKRIAELEDKILTQVGATASQKQAIVADREKNRAAIEALIGKLRGKEGAGAGQPDPGMREQMQKIQKSHVDFVKKTLGEQKFGEYQKAFQAAMSQFAGKGKGKGGPGGAGGQKRPGGGGGN